MKIGAQRTVGCPTCGGLHNQAARWRPNASI